MIDIIFPRFDRFFLQGRRWLTDVISGGAIIRPRPLNIRHMWSCYPWAFSTLPSFACIKRPRWRPVELNFLRENRELGTVYEFTLPDIPESQRNRRRKEYPLQAESGIVIVEGSHGFLIGRFGCDSVLNILVPRGRAPFGQHWPRIATSVNLWEGPTPEVRDSRTSRYSAHAQSQVPQIWLRIRKDYSA